PLFPYPTLFRSRFFANPFVAITCIVHQHIHRAVLLLCGGYHRIDCIEISHVQHYAMGSPGGLRLEGGEGRLAANRADHAIAQGEGFSREGLAEATADAGDEESFLSIHVGAPWGNGERSC